MTLLCECGCGRPAPVARRTGDGYRRGETKRFITGHNKRHGQRPIKAYGTVLSPSGEKVRIHRLRAEVALGKALPPRAVVHHADGTMSDTAPLVICDDQGYHRFLHRRTEIVRAGGDPDTQRLCCGCQSLRNITEMRPRPSAYDGIGSICCDCGAKQSRERRRKRRSWSANYELNQSTEGRLR